jgi:hypothetical protein
MGIKTMASALALIVLLVATTMPAVARAPSSEWHRLNPGGSQATSEHERLTCREAAPDWSCDYDKVPDTGFAWNASSGTFTGVISISVMG